MCPHPVELLLEKALKEAWCCNMYCTTCGCVRFREAVRGIPQVLIDEYLAQPADATLSSLPKYANFITLMQAHQLPRTDVEQSDLRLRQQEAAEASRKRVEEYWERVRQRQAEAQQRKQELSATRAAKHALRRVDSIRRKADRDAISGASPQDRLIALANSALSPNFFITDPSLIDDEVLASLHWDSVRLVLDKLSKMRAPHWQTFRARLNAFL